MSYYSLYCFDLMGSVVFRDNFEAENSAEAKAIAGAICDACADEHHSHELWKGDLPIESSEASAPGIQVPELSAAARKMAQDRMIALRKSSWPVNRSRWLAETIAAWALWARAPVLRPSMIAGCASFAAASNFPSILWMACIGLGLPISEPTKASACRGR
jgi:hypothetical protein